MCLKLVPKLGFYIINKVVVQIQAKKQAKEPKENNQKNVKGKPQ